jgi:uncharacterized protein YbjT (DUF2867 family)
MDAQSVVMFGGTGFIGSHIAARLSDHGVSTVVPTRHASHAMHLMPLGVDIVQADPYDDAALRRLVAGAMPSSTSSASCTRAAAIHTARTSSAPTSTCRAASPPPARPRACRATCT